MQVAAKLARHPTGAVQFSPQSQAPAYFDRGIPKPSRFAGSDRFSAQRAQLAFVQPSDSFFKKLAPFYFVRGTTVVVEFTRKRKPATPFARMNFFFFFF